MLADGAVRLMFVDDETRLRVMRDVAREALELVEGCTRAGLAADRMRQDAVAACLIELREAAAKLTPETRGALSAALPPVLAVGDRLLADAPRRSSEVLWAAVTERLPALCAALDRALAVPAGALRRNTVSRAAAPLARLALDRTRLAAYCERHGIRKLALFGSALRDDFRPHSDLDLLVWFEPGQRLQVLAKGKKAFDGKVGIDPGALMREARRTGDRQRPTVRRIDIDFGS